ncbi:helix-turn-helix domain-containing protein [Streptomyces sp. NPDC021093]|uniref:helix-turn-helix domain-containing protein n=1 Tax=Streptomyces sp. NPDC021093 TaxID=3365112 RepID=UPI00378E77F3
MPQHPQQPGPAEPAAGRGESLAERLTRLFEIVHPRDRGPYSNEEVAQKIAEAGGSKVSHVYLWQLRTGRRDNPTKRHLEALANFFGVPVAYFFDDEEAAAVSEELEMLRVMRDAGVQRVAARVAGLSPKSLKAILAQIEHVRELEDLPPESDA